MQSLRFAFRAEVLGVFTRTPARVFLLFCILGVLRAWARRIRGLCSTECWEVKGSLYPALKRQLQPKYNNIGGLRGRVIA